MKLPGVTTQNFNETGFCSEDRAFVVTLPPFRFTDESGLLRNGDAADVPGILWLSGGRSRSGEVGVTVGTWEVHLLMAKTFEPQRTVGRMDGRTLLDDGLCELNL